MLKGNRSLGAKSGLNAQQCHHAENAQKSSSSELVGGLSQS